jgi:hypothetical protein
MTLDTIIYETIPVTYTAAGTDAQTAVTIDMIADRSLPEGLYLIKLTGVSFVAGIDYTNSWAETPNIKAQLNLYKGTSLFSKLYCFSLDNLRIDATTTTRGTSDKSFTYILTNSAAKPIKINYLAGRLTSSGRYFNLVGTFVFQKLRDLNAGEE